MELLVILGAVLIAALFVVGVTYNDRWKARQKVLNQIARNTRRSASKR